MSDAQNILAQYMALAVDGTPPMGEGTTPLGGKRVTHQGDGTVGTVLGPSRVAGYVWVVWDPDPSTELASPVTGLHRIAQLKEVEGA